MKRIIAAVLIILTMTASTAGAETAWVLCHPDSYVNIRWSPSTRSTAEAQVYAGDEIELDGKKDGKWLHCLCSSESGDGWIRSDYISTDEPDILDGAAYEITKNRTRVRTSASGRVIRMLKKGTTVTVYLMTPEWSVTNFGFIATEFLQAVTNE